MQDETKIGRGGSNELLGGRGRGGSGGAGRAARNLDTCGCCACRLFQFWFHPALLHLENPCLFLFPATWSK